VLSGALKITDKVTLAMEAVGDKIRLNCQGWEDVKVLGERQVLMVVAIKGQLYLLPEHRPAKFERIERAMTFRSAPLPRPGRARKPSAGPILGCATIVCASPRRAIVRRAAGIMRLIDRIFEMQLRMPRIRQREAAGMTQHEDLSTA
jgi:hypothetical protein